MKKVKYLTLALAATTIAGSCSTDRFLDEKPPLTTMLDQAITNESQLKIGVNGLYNNLQSTSTYGGAIPTLSELLADHAFVSINNSNRFALTRQPSLSFYTKFNGDISGIWSGLYGTILNANNVLQNKGMISDDPDISGTPAEYFAQAHAVRAMCYFDLITLFAQYPGGAGANPELGVPLHLDVAFGLGKKRATVSEVYAQILSDLDAANASIASSTERKKLTKAGINMLYSRYYLATRDYQKADMYAQMVLDDTNSTLLPLNTTGIANFWAPAGETNAEVIFGLDFNSLDLPGANDALIATWYSGGTYKQNFATKAFYDTFGAADVRRGRWYTTVGATGVNLANYPDNPKPVDVTKYKTIDRDVVVMRKTEAVFNQLEALYHINPALALTKLNTWVTTFRDPGYSFTQTGQSLLEEILLQKNKELFLEGFRYRDLKRNGIGFTNPQTGVTLSPSNYQFNAFPIPQSEMNTNTEIVQNPGYN